MRVGIGVISHEANSFNPVLTTLRDFQRDVWLRGVEILESRGTEAEGFIAHGHRRNWTLVPTLATSAHPGGYVRSADFKALESHFLSAVEAGMPYDGFLFGLHGAAGAEGIRDASAHLLESLRLIVGPNVCIVVTLDLHANVTTRIADAADALVGYSTVPHRDLAQTGERAALLLDWLLTHRKPLVTGLCRVPVILPALNQWTTPGRPLGELMASCRELEKMPEVLSASVFPVQPWLDEPDTSSSVAVVAETDASARAASEVLAQRLWDLRDEFILPLQEPAEAIAQAVASPGPFLLADTGDSKTAGGTGDNVEILDALLHHDLPGDCAVGIVDPEAVAALAGSRVGERVVVSVGSHLAPSLGRPVVLHAYLAARTDGHFVPGAAAGTLAGVPSDMGAAVVLDVARGRGVIHVLVSSRRSTDATPDAFRSVGIDPEAMRIVVVKTSLHWHEGWHRLIKGYSLVATQGTTSQQIAKVPFRHVPRPTHPLDRLEWTSTGAATIHPHTKRTRSEVTN